MTKIKIAELCNMLKNDIREKSLFFHELSAEEFLIPFQKAGLFNLSDDASYWCVQYLTKVYNPNNKNIILDIINDCLKQTKINNINPSTYYQITQLLDKFDWKTLNKLDYATLLQHSDAIGLIKIIYKHKQILENKKLIKATISRLLKYEIKNTSYKSIAKVDYKTYDLTNLITEEKIKENFKNALTQNFIFKYLLETYIEIYKKTHTKINDISNVFEKQKFDINEIKEKLENNYEIDNAFDIVLYFLCININTNNSDISNKIKVLFLEEIFMLRKLGLYFLYCNINKYVDLLKIFFKHINKENIIDITNICLYELVKIFEKIDKIDCDKTLHRVINKYLSTFPLSAEQLKYEVLHGLKNHPKFENLFTDLKKKYQYEKDNPGIYWQSGIGGWIKNIAPILEMDFASKNIQEQIDYINSDIQYHGKLNQITEDTVEEINERGLIDLFKKTVNYDINKYVDNIDTININKIEFATAFIECMTLNIEKINNINNAILFIDKYFEKIFINVNEYSQLLFKIIEFNLSISQKRHKDFKKIFKYIPKIAEIEYREGYYEQEADLSFVALNTVHGKNTRCYMEHLIKIRKLRNTDISFLTYIMNKSNETKFCTFYYYLGIQYQYLLNRFEQLNLLEHVQNLSLEARKYFLNGYLSYFCYIEHFKDLKALILKSFKNNEIQDEIVRIRFVKMLLDLNLRFNENKIFEEFSKYFSENDYKILLHGLVNNNKHNYKKATIIEFWIDIIKLNNKTYTSLLLEIFNRYCDINDIRMYEQQLKNIISFGIPNNLIANRGIKEFLTKLLEYLKITQDTVVTYNLLEALILSMVDVKYSIDEIDIIIKILDKFKNLNNVNNAMLIARKMYNTECFKFQVSKYKKFLFQ